MERITSRKNPLLMKIRKLSSGSARARREAGEYLGDGVKPVSYTHLRAHET